MMQSAVKYSSYKRKKTYPDQEKNEFRKQSKERMDAFVKSTSRSIVKLISEGQTTAWQKSWKDNPAYGLPKNPISGHDYSRTNLLLLILAMMGHGWQDARFCSFNQAKSIGVDTHVVKDGFGITVLRPVVIGKDNNDDQEEVREKINHPPKDTDLEGGDKIVFFQPYKLYHASQIKNMPAPEDYFNPINWEHNDIIEKLIETCGIELRIGSNKTFYSIGSDCIYSPERAAFEDAACYYGALLHEFYHGTGHSTREARFGEHLCGVATGLQERALEELRAELFSVMAAKALGLPYDQGRAANYINVWNKKCEDDPQQILTQASRVAGMLHTVMQFIEGQQPDAKWFPNKLIRTAFEPVLMVGGSQDDQKGFPIKSFVTKQETWFDLVSHEGSLIVIQSNKHSEDEFGSPNMKDIQEGFRIKEKIESEFPGTVDVKMEAQKDSVILTVREIEPDLGLEENNEEDNGPRR